MDTGRSRDENGPGRQYFVPDPAEMERRRPAVARPGSDRAASTPDDRSRRTPPGEPVPTPRVDPHRRRRPRRRIGPGRIVIGLVVVLALVIGFLGFRALGTYRRIERVDLGDALSPVTGDHVNYLLVGSDSRDEFDPEGSSGVTGSRADTMIVLRTGPNGSKMMSIPRDLWVTVADTGKEGRVNGAYNRGAANLVRTITQNLEIPVNQYIEVGFGSFAGLVDALGGVPIEFPHPAFDDHSGLNVTQTGTVVLDGQQALAFARSRHFTEVVDGSEVKDPTGDLGRQVRQQKFLRSALGELGHSRNPVEILAAGDAMSRGLKVDDRMTMLDMFRLARKLGAADPETVVLPTVPARKGQAAVLLLEQPAAMGVLAGFR